MGKKPSTAANPKSVVILGGGLAGLSAARRMTHHGYHVTLVEKRPFLGGRAFSFHDAQVNWEVDNGPHVFLGCFTYYIDFLKWADSMDRAFLQEKLRTEVLLDSKSGVIKSTPWLGPLHLLPSFLFYPHLSFKEKLLAGYGMLRMKYTSRARDKDKLESMTAHEWFREHGQSERAIRNLWNLIILPTLNDDARDVSADMALMVFQEGLLKGPSGATIGFSRVGLTSLAGEPAHAALESAGNDVMLGKAVKSIRIESDRVSGVELTNGAMLQAEVYVSALPFDALLQVLPRDVAEDGFFSRARGLTSSPIVGIHLWYDRQVMDQDFAAFLDSPVQFVFNKTAIQGDNGYPGQYVCISLSGAWEFVDTPKDELRETFANEMQRLFPKARDAKIERFLVVKQTQATFRPVPGAAKHRLPQQTPIRNLFLAGEWTDTGWPSTMEGAVRSGVFAADFAADSSNGLLPDGFPNI